MWRDPLEFGKLTWPEVARATGKGRVPIVPIGTLEDHGYHLPIDTDVTLVEAVLLPPIAHGYSPHHMDFPGTISIRWDTFCRYCTDVALSLVRHGFERVTMHQVEETHITQMDDFLETNAFNARSTDIIFASGSQSLSGE